jgi:hypothetical protein
VKNAALSSDVPMSWLLLVVSLKMGEEFCGLSRTALWFSWSKNHPKQENDLM